MTNTADNYRQLLPLLTATIHVNHTGILVLSYNCDKGFCT